MAMTLKERIEAVYRGEQPDVVPFMLDLSHWYYHRHHQPWDLSYVYEQPEHELIAYHRDKQVGFYLPQLANFYSVGYGDDVIVQTTKSDDGKAITWRLETPSGTISRTRLWEEHTYAWAIADWSLRSEQDLQVLTEALTSRTFHWQPGPLEAWQEAVGEGGVVYVNGGYSAMGQLMNYWMGVEGVLYACVDWPEAMHQAVDAINANNLELMKMLAQSPATFIVMGDNISSDIQPPHFFAEWSADFYRQTMDILHEAGKYVAVHIDGRLRGALEMVRDVGADAADAVTPMPMGDLSAQECRDEAGPDFILSGGVSPELWLPGSPLERFDQAVLDWLDLRHQSPRLIANAGDQVPPHADEARIDRMRDLVNEHGRY